MVWVMNEHNMLVPHGSSAQKVLSAEALYEANLYLDIN
jgi:hypothetical protein